MYFEPQRLTSSGSFLLRSSVPSTLLISLPVWLKLTGFDSSVPCFASDALSVGIGSGHDESGEVGEAAQRQPLCENSGVLVPTWMVTLSDLRQSFKGRSKVSFILHRGPLSILASSHPLSASCGVVLAVSPTTMPQTREEAGCTLRYRSSASPPGSPKSEVAPASK